MYVCMYVYIWPLGVYEECVRHRIIRLCTVVCVIIKYWSYAIIVGFPMSITS